MATSQTYALTGSTEFAFPHTVREPDELVLNLSVGGLVPPAAYQVIGYGPNSQAVTVFYPGAPTDGTQTLTISRVTPATPVSTFTSDQAVTAKALNDEFQNIYRAILDGTFSFGFDPPVVWQPSLNAIALQTTVIYQNDLYYALVTHVTGATFEPANWQFVTDLTSLIQGTLLQELVASIPYGIPAIDPVFSFVPAHSIDVDNAFSLWRGDAITTATADTVLTIYQNANPIGTITFPAGVATPTFASTGSPPPRHLFNAGDRFAIFGPSTPDATLAGVTLTMPFNLVTLP